LDSAYIIYSVYVTTHFVIHGNGLSFGNRTGFSFNQLLSSQEIILFDMPLLIGWH